MLRVLPEAEINVLCARSHDDELSRVAAARDLDWSKVLEYAQVHGVLPFLAAALDRAAIAVPEPWNRVLASQHRRNVTRSMMQHRECNAIVEALARSGIRAIPFKGTSLSKLLYGRVADRVSGDIDILVREADFARARSVIESLGYAATIGSRVDLETLLTSGNEMLFMNAAGVAAELHWRLFEKNRACGVATRLEDLHLDGDRIENEELFRILVLHALTHGWEVLKWVVDIDAFVRNVGVRWETVFKRAEESGTLRALRIALLLAHEILSTPLPVPIDDRVAKRLAGRYVRVLLTGRRTSRITDFWMQIAARERWIDRFRFIRFVAKAKPWDHQTASRSPRLSRLIRLMSQSFRKSQLAEFQKIPELQPPPEPPPPVNRGPRPEDRGVD